MKRLIILIFSIFIFKIFYGQFDSYVLSFVPDNAYFISVINIENFIEKIDSNIIRNTFFYNEFITELKNDEIDLLNSIFSIPSPTGINFSNYLFFYVLTNNEECFYFLGSINNPENFNQFVQKNYLTIITQNNYYYATDDNYTIIWDKRLFVFINTPLDRNHITDFFNIRNSIINNKIFKKLYNEKFDVAFWINTDYEKFNYFDINLKDYIKNFNSLINDNLLILNFSDNKISFDYKIFLKLKEIYKKDQFFIPSVFNKNYFNFIDQQNLIALISLNLGLNENNIHLKNLINEINDYIFSGISYNYGVILKNIEKALKNDILIVINSFDLDYYDFDYICLMTIKNKKEFDNLIKYLLEKKFIYKKKLDNNSYYTFNEEILNFDINIFIKDDILFLLSSNNLKKIIKKLKYQVCDQDIIDNLKKINGLYSYFDLNKIFSVDISNLIGDYYNYLKYLKTFILKIDFDDELINLVLDINTFDIQINSINLLISLFDNIYRSEQRNKIYNNEEKNDNDEEDDYLEEDDENYNDDNDYDNYQEDIENQNENNTEYF